MENVTYLGSGHFDGIGNALNNVLTGGEGDDILDGGAGADTLNGGLGDDLYVVDSAGDVIIDTGGPDSVETTLAAYILGADIEDLIFAGAGAFLRDRQGESQLHRGPW